MATDCGIRTYHGITPYKRDVLLSELKKQGATYEGSNPYVIDVHKGGVILKGTWHSNEQSIDVEIVDKWKIASCDRVWNTLEPAIKAVVDKPEPPPAKPAGRSLL